MIITNISELTVISGNEFSFLTKSFSSDTDWVCNQLDETTLEQENKTQKSLLKQKSTNTKHFQHIFWSLLD